MNCKKCGALLEGNEKFCQACGQAVAEDATASVPYNEKTEAVEQQQDVNESRDWNQLSYAAPDPMENPMYGQYMGQPPVSQTAYLVFSILATVLCCLPFGIVGIVYAAKISGLNAAGDFDGARKAAKTSMIWTIVSAATAILVVVFYVVVMGFGMYSRPYYY